MKSNNNKLNELNLPQPQNNNQPNEPGALIQYKGTPHVLAFDRVLFVDVDDTIITFNFRPEDAHKCVQVGLQGWLKLALPMTKNIANLKNARTRGHGVVVWSQGGYEWAEAVVKALGLTSYVDLIVSKPSWIYDDLPAADWMPKRFFTPEYDGLSAWLPDTPTQTNKPVEEDSA